MTQEIVQQLKRSLGNTIVVESFFLEETTLVVELLHLKQVLAFLKESVGFAVLIDLTGVDYLLPHPSTKVLYWLHNPNNLARIRVCVYVARNEKIPSVTDLWEGANWYEREAYDLFGILFEGHPDLKRILMPDDWQGHPLRRDYPLTEEAVEFKHGVLPKIPSEIIPHANA